MFDAFGFASNNLSNCSALCGVAFESASSFSIFKILSSSCRASSARSADVSFFFFVTAISCNKSCSGCRKATFLKNSYLFCFGIRGTTFFLYRIGFFRIEASNSRKTRSVAFCNVKFFRYLAGHFSYFTF